MGLLLSGRNLGSVNQDDFVLLISTCIAIQQLCLQSIADSKFMNRYRKNIPKSL